MSTRLSTCTAQHGGPQDVYSPAKYANGRLSWVSPLYVGLLAWSELVEALDLEQAGTELERSLQRASIAELRAELAAREGGAEGVPPHEGFVRLRVGVFDEMHTQ